MQTTPWTLELHSPVGQHNDAARWPDSFPTSHGKHNDLTLPSAHQSKKRRAFVIRTALSAVLVLVLAAYFCRSPGGHWLSKNAVTRRLASSDEDEACQDLLELIERASGGESGESSSPKELFQSSSPGSGTGSRKRRHSTGNQDEVEKFKKPLLEEDSQSTVANVQENLDIPRSSSAEASSAQQQTVSTREREFSVGLQRHDEPSTSSGTQGFEGTLHGAESMARPQAVMDPSDDDLLQQWFLDYILDPAFTESPADDTDRLKDTREHTGDGASAIELQTWGSSPSPEQEGWAARSGASRDGQLPVLESQGVQQYTYPYGMSTGLSSNSASQQESPLRILLQRAMLPKSTSSQASTDGSTLSTSPVETPGPSHTPTSTDGSTPSTSPVETPGPSHTPVPSVFYSPALRLAHFAVLRPPQMDQLCQRVQWESLGPRIHRFPQFSMLQRFLWHILLSSDLHRWINSVNESSRNAWAIAYTGSLSSLCSSASSGTFCSPQTSTDGSTPSTSPVETPGPSHTPTSTDGSTLSTSPVETPGPSHTPSPPDKEDQREHPFYRLPRADCSRDLVPFSLEKARAHTRRIKLPQVLGRIRELLIKRQLVDDELQTLIKLAGKLVNIVFDLETFAVLAVPLCDLYGPVMRRFIIADALWSICEVVGPPMRKEEWWGRVMNRLALPHGARISSRQTKSRRYRLVSRLIAALQIYREGNRPPASEVVDLKGEVFRTVQDSDVFRSPAYDKFREDGSP